MDDSSGEISGAEESRAFMFCPKCGKAVDLHNHGEPIQCRSCQHQFHLAGHLCPSCNSYYTPFTAVCTACGEATARLCSNCNHTNWSGDEYCQQCGVNLDMLAFMGKNTADGHREWLREQMQGASYLKGVEEAASRERMAMFNAMEEERQAELNQQLMKSRAEERKMFLGAAAIILLLVLIYIAYSLLN